MPKPPRLFLSSPHLGTAELEFVREAFATNWIAPLGPHVDAFEKEFAGLVGSPHAAALSSGTAALHLALKLVGLQRGEEVFCSTLTFSASANPIAYEGGRPVFIDSERASWNLDPARLEEALADRARKGRLPRAVILVHLYGQSADLDAIAALCARYEVLLIEDAAEALGARYFGASQDPGRDQTTDDRRQTADPSPRTPTSDVSRLSSAVSPPSSDPRTSDHPTIRPSTNPSQSSAVSRPPSDPSPPSALRRLPSNIAPGTVGRLGIYSFNGNKIITTSGGGMLVSADEGLIAKARFLATQARDPAPHYQHSEIGYNYRLSNVLAGIGRGQLHVLADRVDARRRNCAFYQEAFAGLPGISFMPEAPWNRSTRWLTCIQVDPKQSGTDREALRQALEAENIEARPVWKPMHLQPVFAGCDHFGGEVAEELFARGLCLPSGSNLTTGDLQRVVDVVKRVAR